MANTLKFGAGQWATKEGSTLAYNDENNNFKPLPFNFERGSSATVVNKDGLIETVGSGQPRIDYKDDSEGALLLEPQRTNLITYSSDFSDASWSKTGASATSGFTSPDGTTNAFKLVEGTNNGIHQLKAIGISTVVDRYNFSVFVKPNGRNEIRIVGTNYFSSGTDAYFNLETKVITYGARAENGLIETLANGWFRCSFSSSGGEFVGNNAHMNIETALNNSNSYQGDGTSGVYIYGAMVEQGSYATSYIPTQGSAVTRLADSCSQTVPDGVIGQTEGTMFLDFKPQTLDATSRFLSIENSSSVSNGWMGIFSALVSGDIRFRFYGDGWDFNSTLIIEKDTRYKIAVSYKNGVQTSAYVNGNLIGNLTASLSGKSFQKIRLSEAAIGVRGDADFNDIKLYNTRLSNSELQALTS